MEENKDSRANETPTVREMREAAFEYAENEWKDFPHNRGYAQKDFVAGAEWMRSKANVQDRDAVCRLMCICADLNRALDREWNRPASDRFRGSMEIEVTKHQKRCKKVLDELGYVEAPFDVNSVLRSPTYPHDTPNQIE